MNPFDTFLINPILNLLLIFLKIFQTAGIPQALGLSIILLTAVVRLAIWPLTATQLRSSQKMAALKPHIDRIKDEHGHDKTRHQQELSKLYKEHGVNPLAGCLPLLLQIPIFIALYNVLLKMVEFDKADFLQSINSHLYSPALYLDKTPATAFLGFNLASKPSDWQSAGFALLLIPVITGVLQLVQSKMMVAANNKPKEKGKDGMQDTMSQVQSQMTYLMPVMIAFFAYGFPVGLSLYWNTFTILGIIQQYVVAGAGAMNKFLPEKWQKQN